ncbi:MAG: stage II sporulation protein R [Bacilli bacterium]|nr:stage II sporulation protein R [Bacilli bacterium]
MKTKTIILVIIAFIIIMLVYEKQESIIIPKESIRIRVISNSNLEEDLILKTKVRKNVEKKIYSLLKGINDLDTARKIINDNLDNINNIVNESTNLNYSVKFGNNYFPEKVYKGIIYDEGNYESIVITLGKGMGDNFWCVLFPPLCLLDENDTTSDVEYKFFVKELLDKYLLK